MVKDLKVLRFPCTKRKSIGAKLTIIQFLGNRSSHLRGMEVSENNWLASLCSSELWPFAWWANKLRIQKILVRLIQPQLPRLWHLSACEKLNWQEIQVWRVSKIDSAAQNFYFDKPSFFKRRMFHQKICKYALGRKGGKEIYFFPSASKATGQKDALMVWAGTESSWIGLRKLLKGKKGRLLVWSALQMWFLCCMLAAYFWVQMKCTLE